MGNPTMMDLARRLGEDDKVSAIIEVLAETNEILEDMTMIEGNLPTGHKTTVRTGLPSVTWRKLNYGVQPSKSTTKQVTDSCGMLEAYAKVDKSLVDLNGNTAAFRLSEDKAFIESMNQAMAATTFYGDTATDPEKFVGLAPRFDLTTAENGGQIVMGGGSATNTSLYLVVWGENTVHGIYPKGSKGGLSMEDKGQQTLLDAAGGEYEGYRTHYKWDIGLTVRDWRYVVRIANLNSANLVSGNSAADLIKHMVAATELIPNLNAGRAVFYCNRLVKTALRNQILAKAAYNLTFDSVAGKHVLAFDGIPVRRCDQILNSEATIV